MAPIVSLYRLAFGGRLFDTEGWSCSLHVHSDTGINLAASNFRAALIAYVGRADSLFSQSARLDFIKFNEINPATARYVLPFTNQEVQNDMATGPASVGPGQVALAVGLTTALARGRGHAGRFYVPCGMGSNAMPSVATGLVSSTIIGAATTSAISLINDINTAVGPGSRVCVFSKVGQLQVPVTGVRVGRVYDTVRSRRRSLPEQYVGGAVA